MTRAVIRIGLEAPLISWDCHARMWRGRITAVSRESGGSKTSMQVVSSFALPVHSGHRVAKHGLLFGSSRAKDNGALRGQEQ